MGAGNELIARAVEQGKSKTVGLFVENDPDSDHDAGRLSWWGDRSGIFSGSHIRLCGRWTAWFFSGSCSSGKHGGIILRSDELSDRIHADLI